MSALKFGKPGEFKRAESDNRKHQTIVRLGTVVTRPAVTRGYLEKLERRQRERDMRGVEFRSLAMGTLPESILDEYPPDRIDLLLDRASRNAAVMEVEQQMEAYS